MSVMRDMKKQGDLVPDSYAFSIAMMACSKAVSVATGCLCAAECMKHSVGLRVVH